MCDFVVRTNWSNTKSNYFVDTIVTFNLSYYTNIMIVITFMNQATLCRAFFFVLQSITCTSPVPSSTSICTCLIFTQKFLTAPTSFTMWSSWPSFKTNLSESNKAEWIIFAMTGISICLPLFKTPFTTIVLNDSLSSMKGSSLTNWLPFPFFFLDLVWQTMLPSPTASFHQGTMVLRMSIVSPASSLLFKSMKHCSHGSSNLVKNANTGN